MRGETAKLVLGLLAMVALLGGGITCGVYRWRECRRVHPWWYCAGDGGSH